MAFCNKGASRKRVARAGTLLEWAGLRSDVLPRYQSGPALGQGSVRTQLTGDALCVAGKPWTRVDG